MERMPDFEQQERELNAAIIVAFDMWKAFLLQFMEEDELKRVDCVDQFCNHVRRRLEHLLPELQHLA